MTRSTSSQVFMRTKYLSFLGTLPIFIQTLWNITKLIEFIIVTILHVFRATTTTAEHFWERWSERLDCPTGPTRGGIEIETACSKTTQILISLNTYLTDSLFWHHQKQLHWPTVSIGFWRMHRNIPWRFREFASKGCQYDCAQKGSALWSSVVIFMCFIPKRFILILRFFLMKCKPNNFIVNCENECSLLLTASKLARGLGVAIFQKFFKNFKFFYVPVLSL